MRPGAEEREHAHLINPFAIDPSDHLDFDELGRVRGKTRAGRITIYTCGLARQGLERERERVAKTLARDIDDYEDSLTQANALSESQTLRRLLDACRPDSPYAAMARAIVHRRTKLTYEELVEAEELGLLGQ